MDQPACYIIIMVSASDAAKKPAHAPALPISIKLSTLCP
jgi:hypothetical protein